jgi:hypothetical protein
MERREGRGKGGAGRLGGRRKGGKRTLPEDSDPTRRELNERKEALVKEMEGQV